MHTRNSLHTRYIAATIALSAAGALAQTSLYWDANSNLGGSNTWDINTTEVWSTTNAIGNPNSPWMPNDGTVNAVFNGSGAYSASIASGATINVNSIILGNSNSNTTIAGGTALDLANTTASIIMNTGRAGANRAQIISAPISGTDISIFTDATNQTLRTLLTLSGNNTFTGNLIFTGAGTPTGIATTSQVNINTAGALPSTASVLMARNWSQLLFTAGGASGTAALIATYNNPINLNSTGIGNFESSIGSTNAGSVITLAGPITGAADLSFGVGTNGGSGTIVLSNPNNSWTGQTQILVASAGIVRMGVNNALPTSTTLSFGTASISVGAFDMDGFNQTVAGLTGTTSSIGIVNTGTSQSTLTINGNVTGTYTGAIAPLSVSGSNTHIALTLAATNTGTLTLTNAASKYDGGTTINGGTLLVSNAAGGSPTGSGPVTVGTAGSFGSTGVGGGGVSGHVDNSGTITPGGNGAVGTLSLAGGLTAEAGSNINFDIGSSTDTLFLGGADDATLLSTPGGAQSVAINLNDPAYSVTNQTYKIVTYSPGTTLSGLDTSASGPFKIVAPHTGVAQGASFTLTNNSASHEIDLTVTGAANYITWAGDANGNGTWDTNTTANFVNNSTPTVFNTYDNVTFNDSANAGSGNNTISVTIPAGGVTPSQTNFNNTVRNYVVVGGPINGTGNLVKSGNGFLTIDGPNNYSGGTVINGGTLNTSEDSGLGAAGTPVALNGGTLQYGLSFNPLGRPFSVGANGGSIDTNGFNTTIDGALTNNGITSGTFTKQGAGTLTLTNHANTFSGATVLNNGTLSVTTPYTTTSGIIVNAGATLQIAPNAGGSAINAATLTIAAGGTFDITNNTVSFNTTVTGHSAATLQADLTSAYDKGGWDLPGISSSLAAVSNGKTTLGWTNSGNTFTIRYTIPGDATLDGKVDNSDLAAISSTGTTWATGDFNYDGVVNNDDWSLFMLGAALGTVPSSPAPEPAGCALVIVMSSGLLARRVRRVV